MSQTMNLVLGTRDYLTRLVKQSPERLILMEGMASGQTSAIIDPAGLGRFDDPTRLTVLNAAGEMPDEKGYFHMMYFRLKPEDFAILTNKLSTLIGEHDRFVSNLGMWSCQTPSKIPEILFISAWQHKLSSMAAKGQPLYAPVIDFIDIAASEYGFHESLYQVIDPNEPEDEDEDKDKDKKKKQDD